MRYLNPSAPCPAPLALVYRGRLVESIHRGHLVVSRADGEVLRFLGDPDFPTFLRSAAKPFQALAVVETGAAKRYGISEAELALMCGSVSGQDYHVAAVRSVLSKAGLDESLLECGPQKPSHRATAKALEKAGLQPLPIHNNCAGKHAAMLLLAVHLGLDTAGYYKESHPVQKLIKEAVASLCGLLPGELGVGIDGCGVPVFRAPLRNVALGYARLANPEGACFSAERVKAVKALMGAALAHPEMIAGDERVCTETMRSAPGRFLAKTGAEASYGLSLMAEKTGVAFKVEDGAQRALDPIVVEILKCYNIIGPERLLGLKSFQIKPLTNYRREEVGHIAAAPLGLQGLG